VTPSRSILGICLLAGGLTGSQQTVFRGGTQGVLVDVSVRDGKRSVSGLRPEDFRLLDDSVPQTIVDLTTEVIPLDVTVLIDVSESARLLFGDTLIQAGNRARGLFGPNDHIEVRDFGAQIVDATTWNGESLGSWATGSLFGDRGTALFDALAIAVMRPPAVGFRRLVIVVTDGRDTASFVNHQTLLAIVKRADAVVDVVAAAVVAVGSHSQLATDTPTNLPRPAETLVTVHDYANPLKKVTDLAGGYFFDLNENSRSLEALGVTVAEFRSRYLLKYVPSGVGSRGWHTITISVPGHGYQVVARKGYVR